MSKPKLNQIIAVCNGKKTQQEKALTEIYKKIQKPDLFAGISRTYQPLNDDGETQPSEKKLPQYTATEAINEAKDAIVELIDVVATQDTANTKAKANVVVEGKTILQDVPVTHLLFLEKQLTDIQTFVSKLPVLDAGEQWRFDDNVGYNVAGPNKTNRTMKQMKNHVLAEATDKHPAQVQVYTEDVKVGEWTTLKFSGCVDAKTQKEMLARVKSLIEAVKMAREEANSMEIDKVYYGKSLVEFVFGK